MRPQVIKLIRILDSEGNQVFQEDGITPLVIPMDEHDYLLMITDARKKNPGLSDSEVLSGMLDEALKKAIAKKKAENTL